MRFISRDSPDVVNFISAQQPVGSMFCITSSVVLSCNLFYSDDFEHSQLAASRHFRATRMIERSCIGRSRSVVARSRRVVKRRRSNYSLNFMADHMLQDNTTLLIIQNILPTGCCADKGIGSLTLLLMGWGGITRNEYNFRRTLIKYVNLSPNYPPPHDQQGAAHKIRNMVKVLL